MKQKTIMWKGIEIPNKECFKQGKKCTPDCSSYDVEWLYLENEHELKMMNGLKNEKIFVKYGKINKMM